MRTAFPVSAVRIAEAAEMQVTPGPELMQTAAHGLAGVCLQLLREQRGLVTGARVALLVGSGNNGGDTLFAGSRLARRGAAVVAVATSAQIHEAGLAALIAAGGRMVRVTGPDPELTRAVVEIGAADLVLDGIVGIGASGGLREPAAALVAAVDAERTIRVAVDVPSGIDPDTGAVPEGAAVFNADVTVTFGCLKPGLLLPPGRAAAGVVELVDIGLEPHLVTQRGLRLLTAADVARILPEPAPADYKYSRGVVGVVAGSARFPGAAQLVTGAARHAEVGMVRIADRSDGVAPAVVARFPDVVPVPGNELASDPRATAWVIGPGCGTGGRTAADVRGLLLGDLPVVLDADAITVVARHQELRDLVRERPAATVLTPHLGEFRALGFDAEPDRVTAAVRAAAELRAVVVLKGPGTVIADPSGQVYLDPVGSAALATAGTGDVLAGLIAAALSDYPGLPVLTAEVTAAAVFLHGLAARRAGSDGRPMTSWDLVAAIPETVSSLRS